jgi:hypothetical protein
MIRRPPRSESVGVAYEGQKLHFAIKEPTEQKYDSHMGPQRCPPRVVMGLDTAIAGLVL